MDEAPLRAVFRDQLAAVPAVDRDAWVDQMLGLDGPPEDDSVLPRECVPYLPCPVEAIVRAVDVAGVTADDVIVDVGSGVGRAAVVFHLITGAQVVGLEVQPSLVARARALTSNFGLRGVSFLEGDVEALELPPGTVFFLYCPFSGARLERFLARVRDREGALRLCCVDLPLPPGDWLQPIGPTDGSLVVYRRAQEVTPRES